MYVSPDFKTKKAFKEAVKAGKSVEIFDPGPFWYDAPANGTVSVEGPHYPMPHTWYASVTIVDSKITRIS